jgi:hypoxanthine phosphoribosyltransferase
MTSRSSEELLEKARKLRENARLLYSNQSIVEAVSCIAEKLNERFKDDNPIVVGVLAGAAPFMGQLLTKLSFDLRTDYVRIKSFSGDARGDLVWDIKPGLDFVGKTIIIVEDVIDSGLTLAELVRFYRENGAKTVCTVALFDKKNARLAGGLPHVDFCGMPLDENFFLIGFGLDYHGYLRNLPDVYLCS